ncbi:MAG TPA: SigB/SigF/SigG family RNA polymerase sigma factor [Solirubrobacteraceae bacterium]|jgi:RNA polymerase sigma-B factor|nr:SigB/SigF/SigG family RNA polymerase sigma factor [Solirubrobacteraceae bacterium]
MFVELRANPTPALRDHLVELHLPLARSVASRYRHTPQPFDDLLQVASMALVKAVDRFEPERGLAFSSFAVPTMIGEIKRHFRDTAWALHVPRALKERILLVERCERDLSSKLGRAPTVEDLGEAAGLSTEAVLDALEARSAHDTESIDAALDDDETGLRSGALGADDVRLELVDVRSALSSAMDQLAERDRKIIELRFVGGLTQTQIAERVGVSQMQVSRLLRSALAELRDAVDIDDVP